MLKVPGVCFGYNIRISSCSVRQKFHCLFKETAMVSESGFTMQSWNIDYDYVKTLGIKLIEGRNFSPDFGSDSSGIILNETAVKQLGISRPYRSKNIYLEADDMIVTYHIIGVVKDFNFESLRQNIGAYGMFLEEVLVFTSLKLNAANTSGIIKAGRK